ncbi:Bug family tripartite tricarboxylate transporter substrate binding protein [Pseudomonas typographi]|uniref:Tripartite tricarboxylate transporter substrate binding protein n=1 Tax=Pseudomonas typographi TaxID=2715964 RepID=A0ABR7YWU5_9PSED|nr:tripartite tricarboxylate transporter substrate binding protein [Pseudomonas typographi]MBD1552605.1 tripartite tricarboxylate transporter substrate binding protein [Pseudomonas typographi]MBD1586186.1 tripartite tricarboxylate transporter substrate binding protein [Pseudomonas typographi]MBD1597657.1 tripartite tricarboxylate transporter substrate binding protein [Pseudomonas typographi]
MNLLKKLTVAALVALCASTALAQYPDKPITYVVPYTPGGTNDNIARIIARHLGERLGQPIVVENKPGAAGTLGAAYVAHAAADGYTLLNASIGNLAIAPQLLAVQFDPFNDLTPVAHLAGSRSVIAVNPALPIHSIAELIAYAKAHPGELTYGTSGNGTPGHISTEYLKLLAGIDLVHVPYKGSAQALSDATAGHIDLVSDPLANTFVQAGKLRGLAYFGTDEAPDLPGIPSLTETYPQWKFSGSYLAMAPAGTPPDVLASIRQAFDDVLAEPETISELKALGMAPQRLSTEQSAALIRATHDVSQQIIAQAHIKAG